ncbi:MAG: DUF899 family protein [Gammaproteobacteria bacterium]|nr:DUF899 family protein [Gammaproteobacteria bacterium]
MSAHAIQDLEKQIYDLTLELNKLRQSNPRQAVKNYTFDTVDGQVTLLDLFAGKDQLLAVHNMGQGCRYCTLWGDGFNPFLPHLESAMSVVMLSKDDPQLQRRFANSRGWRFRMASHGGRAYIKEQTVSAGSENYPGAVCYEREGNDIYRKNSCVFGPGDLYCSMWGLLALAGLDESSWTPQYNYWLAPKKLDDGGDNILE